MPQRPPREVYRSRGASDQMRKSADSKTSQNIREMLAALIQGSSKPENRSQGSRASTRRAAAVLLCFVALFRFTLGHLPFDGLFLDELQQVAEGAHRLFALEHFLGDGNQRLGALWLAGRTAPPGWPRLRRCRRYARRLALGWAATASTGSATLGRSGRRARGRWGARFRCRVVPLRAAAARGAFALRAWRDHRQ